MPDSAIGSDAGSTLDAGVAPDAGRDAGDDAGPPWGCWPEPEGLDVLDCDDLARRCSLPLGSSCGGDVYPVNCCTADPTATLSGRVLDETGAPMGGVYVRLALTPIDPAGCEPLAFLFSNAWDPSATTDSSGAFEFEPGDLTGCHFTPLVQTDEFTFTSIRTGPDAETAVVLGLRPGRRLDLRVVRCTRAGSLSCWVE